MHLPTAIFMSFSLCAVCKMSFIWKKYDSQCTQTTQNTECPVDYSVYFLFNDIFIKYLFVKLFFYPFSNDFKFLKYKLK